MLPSLVPGEKEKHKNKIPRKSQEKAGTVPGSSREIFVYSFSCLLVFFPALFSPLSKHVVMGHQQGNRALVVLLSKAIFEASKCL